MTLNVVYLDDEAALCEIFFEYFDAPDVSIRTFVDALQALAAVKSDPPDVIFIDYQLPGITGDEVALLLPDDLPKVLVTGNLSVATEYSFIDCVSKPYDFALIQRILDRFKK